MMPDNPPDAVRRLAERLEEEAAKFGLKLVQFFYAPRFDKDVDETEPDRVHAVFALTDAAGEQDPDKARVDAEFEELTRNLNRQDLIDKIKEARDRVEDELRQNLSEGKGILDDDE